MEEKIAKHELLKVLAKRKNFGCHPELGKAGKIIRFSKARVQGALAFKAGIDIAGEEPRMVVIPKAEFRRRGLEGVPGATEAGRPAFVLEPGTQYTRLGALFVAHPDEILLLLRMNLQFLHQLNDRKSKQLRKDLTGLSDSSMPAPEHLCLSLVDLRKASRPDFLKVIEGTSDRAQALKAADRGEILYVLKSCGRLASELQPCDVLMLRSVVRAHYFPVLQKMLKGGASLSSLGRKIFARGGTSGFTPEERQALLLMSISVAGGNSPASGGIGGKYLLGEKG